MSLSGPNAQTLVNPQLQLFVQAAVIAVPGPSQPLVDAASNALSITIGTR